VSVLKVRLSLKFHKSFKKLHKLLITTFRSGTDLIATHILLILLILVLVGANSSKNPKLLSFQTGAGQIWQDFSSSIYASNDGVRFSI